MARVRTAEGRCASDAGCQPQRQQRAGEDVDGAAPQCTQETAAEKLERSRQLNLAAQARYRRKLADSVRELEATVEARQCEISKAGDRRFRAYTRNRELHTRDAQALATLISLAGSAVARTKCSRSRSRPPPEPAVPAAPPWSVKYSLRQSIAAVYTPPATPAPKSATADSAGSSSATAVTCVHAPASSATVPAPLSGPQILAAFPQQDASTGLPYACVPSKAAAAAAMHVRVPNSQDPSARTAAATVARFSGKLRHLGESVAASAGVRTSAVQWLLQSPWKVASGSAVALTAQMSAPASVSSFYLCTFTLHLEDLFVAAALYPNEPLPTVLGTPTPVQHDGPSGCDADATAATIHRELQRMLAAAYGSTGAKMHATTELCCGVCATHPVARGVPHVVSSVCLWYRQRLPRRQWLQVLSAFVAAAGSKRTFASGVPAQETCRHRELLEDGREVHTVPGCLRCSVFATALQALQECLALDTEGSGTVRAMSTEQIRGRITETASFAALLQSQFLLEEPWFSRSLLHSCGITKHLAETEQQLMITLYARLKLTPQQRQVTAALWKCWLSRRRAHDRVYTAAMRHVIALLPPAPSDPLRGEDHVCRDPRRISALEPAGSSRAVIMRTQVALKALRALHRQDGDMLAEITRALRMPGTFFVAEQLAMAVAIAAQHSMHSVDWLWVCRCAAEDLAREAMFAGID